MGTAVQQPAGPGKAKDEANPSPYPNCEKCGEELNASPYGATKQAVVEMASDHASKRGCDWAAKNLDKVWQLSEAPMKKHEADVKAASEKEEARLKKEKEDKEKAAAAPAAKKADEPKKPEEQKSATPAGAASGDKK